jgi:hypothetical protein
MIIEKIHCDICKSESISAESANFHWTKSFGAGCALVLKPVPTVQQNITWEHLCPDCGKLILDAVLKIMKERKKELT